MTVQSLLKECLYFYILNIYKNVNILFTMTILYKKWKIEKRNKIKSGNNKIYQFVKLSKIILIL